MKLKCEQEIKAGREAVRDVADDPGNIHRWQPTLKSHTTRAGTPGQPGPVADLVEAGGSER